MARIMCIDYGAKRTGLAVTDMLRIIATPLCTVDSTKLLVFLSEYCKSETVDLILIGMPFNLDDSPTDATFLVEKIIKQIKKNFPTIKVETIDERYSSKQATKAMIEMGMKKKQRTHKPNTDVIAATMLLQTYLSEHY